MELPGHGLAAHHRRPARRAEQEDALRRVLVAACDHGLAAPSIAAARTCASTRGAPGVAMATGLLAFAGPAHGGAAGACARGRSTRSAGPPLRGRCRRPMWSASSSSASRAGSASRASATRTIARDPRVPGLMSAPLPDDGYRRSSQAVEDVLVAAKGPGCT